MGLLWVRCGLIQNNPSSVLEISKDGLNILSLPLSGQQTKHERKLADGSY